MSNFSIKYNEKARAHIARFKKVDGGWGTKQIPKQFQRHQEVEAEHWFIAWYAEHQRTWGVNIPSHQINPAAKTLLTMGQKWLDFRYQDKSTKINTLQGFRVSFRNWILDNEKFDHYSIQTIDLENGFSPTECKRWIHSLKGSDSSKLQHIGTLKTFFSDCIGMHWLNPNMFNPFDNAMVKKEIDALFQATKSNGRKTITFIPAKDMVVLLTAENKKIPDFRRIRYLVAVATGMRDHELQGLTFSDVLLKGTEQSENVPFVKVERQLDKIGCKPIVRYEELVQKGSSKDEIRAYKNAVVSNPKRKSFRLIPLHPLVVKAMQYWFEYGWQHYVGRKPENDDPIFPVGGKFYNRIITQKGDFCFPESAELVREDLKRLGLPIESEGKPIVFHSLRHSFSTYLADAGVDNPRIDALLGHASKTVAEGYYIAKRVPQSLPAIMMLPLPQSLTLTHCVISVEE